MTTVFVAGHGRMYTNKPMLWVPTGVTIKWAVPPKYQSSGTAMFALQTVGRSDKGVSTNILSGTLGAWAQKANRGDLYHEHWLCPDGDNIMAGKGYAFNKKNWGTGYYLLQPQGKCAVKLSDILTFLKRKVGTPLELFWTCCRSPIHGKAIGRKVVNAGVVADDPTFNGPGATDVVEPGGESKNKAEQKAADETSLTLKPYGATGLDLRVTWPGLNSKTGGSKQAQLISTMI